MTLRDILKRLESIDTISTWAYCMRCWSQVPASDSDQQRALADLRLDIERYLLKTEGTL